MNRGDFINIVRDHGLVENIEISTLNEIVNSYPYCQSAYTLILNWLFKTDNIGFEERLKKSAIYIADRKVLYNILNNKEITIDLSVDKSLQVETSSGRSREQLRAEIEKRLSEIEIESGNLVDTRQQGTRSDIDTIGSSTENPADWSEDDILIIEGSVDATSGHEITPQDVEQANHDGGVLLDIDFPPASEGEERIITENELIDRFIELEPRIDPRRELNEEPLRDITPVDEEVNSGLITETLAKIYLNQGYYTKAILIYERLILKFPEKSSYFATQIEKIKGFIS
ncbi:MAG TPA: hypothetical protein VMW76_00790 [Bacteroidales bacterium]|nr:hypothetical protein [Bacteroidales bacterium]